MQVRLKDDIFLLFSLFFLTHYKQWILQMAPPHCPTQQLPAASVQITGRHLIVIDKNKKNMDNINDNKWFLWQRPPLAKREELVSEQASKRNREREGNKKKVFPFVFSLSCLLLLLK